jgi:hypothetical protein
MTVSDGDASRRRVGMGLIAVAILSVTVRVAAVFAVGSYRLDHVTYEHGEIARHLVEGRGFTVKWLGAEGPTSQQAPVYPVLVASFYWLFGVQTAASLLALQLFQSLLGGLLSVGIVLLGMQLLGSRSAAPWLGGIGVALYPTLIYSVAQVQVVSIVSLLLVAVLWSASRAMRSARWQDATGCGVLSGLLVLSDPIMSLVVCVALLMIFAHCVAGRVRLCVAAVAAMALVVSPWIVRNYRVHGEWVFVKSTFGYAFWQGNHERSFGTDKIPLAPTAPPGGEATWGIRSLERSLWHTRLIDTLYIDDAVLSNERIEELSRLSEPERSRVLAGEAMGYLRSHPGHYAQLCVQRLRYFLLFDETNPKSRVLVYRMSHLVLQALALAGLWLSRRQWRRLWPTYAAFAAVTLFHVLTIVSARFHLPLEPIEWIWSGCACGVLLETARRWIAQARRLTHGWRPIPISTHADISSGLSH